MQVYLYLIEAKKHEINFEQFQMVDEENFGAQKLLQKESCATA